MGQAIRVDDPAITIRKRYRDPHHFVGANWKPMARRNDNIWRGIQAMNLSNPAIKPYDAFRT